ncbi:MAG: hypothetical protein H6739_38310 [Alphaproteobacteria bacterium]|nr:hypothetical protein [Alphaproteobacteria bacterium]
MRRRALALTLTLGLALWACCSGEEPAEIPAPPGPSETPASETPAASTDLPTPVLPAHTVTTPYPVPASPDVEKTLEVLKGVVGTYATDPEDPWAVGHGMLALGPDLQLSNGQPAVDWLFSQYAQPAEVSGHTLPAFPRSVGDIRVEPHTDLLLKVFTEVGVSPDKPITAGGTSFAVRDAWRHSLLTTFLKKSDGSSSYDSPNDMPWGVQGLAAWAPPNLRWTAYEGTEMTLDDLTRLMVHVLTTESAFMIRAMASNEGFEKRGQGIFKYTCGGAHLLQGSIFAVARGYGGDAERNKMAVQGQLLFYRFPRELEIYAKAAIAQPNFQLVLTAQQLKFVGHWLESAHKMAASGLYTPSPAEQQQMAEAVDVLVATVMVLKKLGALDNLEQIRGENEQLYLDLVGDSAHAIRGLELALGRQTFSY